MGSGVGEMSLRGLGLPLCSRSLVLGVEDTHLSLGLSMSWDLVGCFKFGSGGGDAPHTCRSERLQHDLIPIGDFVCGSDCGEGAEDGGKQ